MCLTLPILGAAEVFLHMGSVSVEFPHTAHPTLREQVLVLPWGGSADWQSGGSVRGHQGEVTVEIMFLFCVSLFISSVLLICICEHREHLLIEV